MHTKIKWTLLIIGVLALTLLVFSGSFTSPTDDGMNDLTLTDEHIEESEQTAVPTEDLTDILILGDSIGSGVGDDEQSGFGERYIALLEGEYHHEEIITNLSVPGYVTHQLVSKLDSGEHHAMIEEAQLIILSIGGNDLNRVRFEDDIESSFEEALSDYKDHLDSVIREIRSVNQDAQLAFIGLYNPYEREFPELTNLLLVWNEETRSIINSYPNTDYIPTYQLFNEDLDSYLASDQFHPSALGYQVIAEQLYAILN